MPIRTTHRFAHLTLLSFLPDPHKPYEEVPMHVSEDDLEPLSLLYAALCISGAPTGDVTAERALAILTEVDRALGFERSEAPKDVQELIATIEAGDEDPDEDDEDDDPDEDDEDDEDDEEDDEEEAALDARLDFVELVADLLQQGGDSAKVVAQAKEIGASFQRIFVGDET